MDHAVARAARRNAADVVLDQAVLRVVRAEQDVAGQRELHAAAVTQPVDGGDHRLLQRLEVVEAHVVLPVVEAELRRVELVAAQDRDVDARGKGAAVAGDHQHLDPVVVRALADDLAPLLEHLLREAVEVLRAVERHGGDAVVADIECDGFVRHACSFGWDLLVAEIRRPLLAEGAIAFARVFRADQHRLAEALEDAAGLGVDVLAGVDDVLRHAHGERRLA